MAQIEDQRPCAKSLKNARHAFIQRLAARDETHRVEIALHGHVVTHLLPLTLLLAVVAIILGMARRDDVRGTFLDSHFSWLSRTFWWGLLWIGICGVLTFLLIVVIIGIPLAWLPFTVLFFWYLYRVIKGWLQLHDGRPVG